MDSVRFIQPTKVYTIISEIVKTGGNGELKKKAIVIPTKWLNTKNSSFWWPDSKVNHNIVQKTTPKKKQWFLYKLKEVVGQEGL